MRKIKLFIACSLDGYIARMDGSVDWLFTDHDYGYNHFYASIDTVVMGRKTYEQLLTLGDYPYKGKINYVVSRLNPEAQDDNVIFITDNIAEFMRSLLVGSGRDIWLVGGGELIDLFIQERLIDEFIISVHPVLLGSGIPLFKRQQAEMPLVLMGCTPFASGLVQLCYHAGKV